MTAIEARRSLLEEIAGIIENENLTLKALKYVRKLKAKEEEQEYITKEEILAGIDAGLKDMKLAMDGKIEPLSAEEFLKELRNE